jgi:hypothetical protein
MTPEGFYRVTWDGMAGIGCCRHYVSAVREEPYEDWNIMFARMVPGERLHIANTHVDSTDRNFAHLNVGKRIPGLPRKFGCERK